MAKFVCLALALMLIACNEFHPPKEQEAVALVWDFYGASRRPPKLTWKRGGDLDCGSGNRGFYRALTRLEKAVHLPPQCVVGVFWEDTYSAQVAMTPSFGQGALAHELLHAHIYNKTGRGDADHEDPGFDEGGLVDQADELLRKWLP